MHAPQRTKTRHPSSTGGGEGVVWEIISPGKLRGGGGGFATLWNPVVPLHYTANTPKFRWGKISPPSLNTKPCQEIILPISNPNKG